jgi:WD40 repeat protein
MGRASSRHRPTGPHASGTPQRPGRSRSCAVLRGLDGLRSAAFSPDGSRIVTASSDKTARIWDVHTATMSSKGLVLEVCLRPLRGLTMLSRDEMRLAGYADDVPEIDVCAGIE